MLLGSRVIQTSPGNESAASGSSDHPHSLRGITEELRITLEDAGARSTSPAGAASGSPRKNVYPNLSVVLSRAHVGILHRDLDRRVLVVNDRYCQLVGRTAEELAGRHFEDFTHPDDAERSVALYDAQFARAEPFEIEKRYIRPDGSAIWCAIHVSFVTDEAGRVTSTISVAHDISDQREASRDLRESEERFRLAAEAAGLGIWDYDALRERREWSRELTAMFGLPADTEPSTATALQLVHPADRHIVEKLFAAALNGDSDYSFEATFRVHRADDGSQRWMSTGGWRTFTEKGRLSRVLVTMRDVTDQRTADERVRWSAEHDALTGLPNRGHFGFLLDEALAQAKRAKSKLGLILFDVDRLKETNDLIGHEAGDLLLQTFAERALLCAPDGIVARLGGDEFAILLPGAGEEGLRELTGRLMPLLREPFTASGYTLDCQATAGASFYPAHGTTAADLLKAADVALYVGKDAQRGSLSIFEADMRAGLQRRASMLRVARTIVADDLVLPFYQPKVSLDDRRVVGFEALLRWRHHRLGIQRPDSIVAAFEHIELATALSERMLGRIVRDMRRWLDEGRDFGRVAFNLSPAEFKSNDLEDRILRHLDHARIPPSCLELEVTETVFLSSGAERVGVVLQTFHDAGIRIALDDFGTGYASLAHLKAFPVDVIKIDRSFVSSLTTASSDAAIVNAVIGLGRDMGMEVIAEGVETEDQAALLRQQGCKFAQGYLFGRPVAADEATALLG